MRVFIGKLLLFAAIVVAVIGGLCAAEIAAEIQKYREEIVAPAGATVALCGDSQMSNAADPSVGPEFFNFSAYGRSLDQTYMVMIDLLSANAGQIRKVVVDVPPAAATWPLDKPLHEKTFSGNYWLIHYLHLAENTRDLRHGFKVIRDNLVGRRLRLALRAMKGRAEFHSSIRGKFTPTIDVAKRDNPAYYQGLLRQKAQLTRGAGDIAPDSLMFACLDKMRALAADSSVEFVVTTTPWHRDLIGLCGEAELDRFSEKLFRWAADRNVRYVNELKMEMPDDCWADANHLNLRGAKIFTERLSEALK